MKTHFAKRTQTSRISCLSCQKSSLRNEPNYLNAVRYPLNAVLQNEPIKPIMDNFQHTAIMKDKCDQ